MNLVGNERLDADLITELAHDEDPQVRASVAVRADVTEELRTSISAGLPPDTPWPATWWPTSPTAAEGSPERAQRS
ncbi:hypothetical protein ACFV30_19065 [Streptomyces sp. NPDC059752]|uniref:hypothetical protein n=1 Tax=unclassified Streptomyces TaxID=2593676 RepID=UPI00365981FE